MAEHFTDYVCPNCRGTIHFDALSGQMKCDYCESLFSVEEIKEFYAKHNEINAAQDGTQASISADGGMLLNMKAYKCQTCGAEIICDETTAATSCPYCGNQAIIPQQFTGMLRPRYVIPFKTDKESTKINLESYCKKKKFLPKQFRQENHIDEIKGIYVPFWLYSGTVDAYAEFEGKKESVTYTSKERITTTRYYEAERSGTASFAMIPTDASSNMADDLMDSIEPFDYSGICDFEMEYLLGFLADKYDVSKEDSIDRARKRAENSTVGYLKNTVAGYTSVTETRRSVDFSDENQDYAMFPVWLLCTKWKEQNFLFAINGQTGKMTGNLPINRFKEWLVVLLVTIPLMALSGYFGFSTDTIAGIIGFGISLIIGFSVYMAIEKHMHPVAESRTAGEYKTDFNLKYQRDRFLRETVDRERINNDR